VPSSASSAYSSGTTCTRIVGVVLVSELGFGGITSPRGTVGLGVSGRHRRRAEAACWLGEFAFFLGGLE
jgi:hypothetical protein